MTRLALIAASIAATTLTIGIAVPARAQSPVFRAVPVTVASGNVIAGDSLWACGTDGCTARAIASRPVIACTQVAKKIGRLDSFTANGATLGADELAKCNAKAKGATAMARN